MLNTLYEANDNTIIADLSYAGGDGYSTLTDAEPVWALADNTVYGLITAISNASPPQITSAGHGLSTNDKIGLYGVTGVNLNRGVKVTVVDANNFTITELDGTAIAAPGTGYPGSGGAWRKLVTGADGLNMTQSGVILGRYSCILPGTASFRRGTAYTAFIWDKNLYTGKFFIQLPITVKQRAG